MKNLKRVPLVLTSVAQLVRVSSHIWKVVGFIPGQGIYLGCCFVPLYRCMWSLVQAHTVGTQSMPFSCIDVSFSPPFFLSKRMEKCPQVRGKNVPLIRNKQIFGNEHFKYSEKGQRKYGRIVEGLNWIDKLKNICLHLYSTLHTARHI